MNEIIKRAIGKLQVSFLAQLSEEEQITILQHKLQTLYDVPQCIDWLGHAERVRVPQT
jgi:hypothetical protein